MVAEARRLVVGAIVSMVLDDRAPCQPLLFDLLFGSLN
jgi:hypothetical protein